MRKKLLSIIMALAMIATTMPMTALAAGADAKVYIAGTEYTSSGENLPEGVDIKWEDNTITLTNATIEHNVTSEEGTISMNGQSAVVGIMIMDSNPWTLKLTGENTISVKSSLTNGELLVAGILPAGALTIISADEDGDGKLTVDVEDTMDALGVTAIMTGNLQITECTVEVNVKTVDYNPMSVISVPGTLKIDNATVNATTDGRCYHVIYAQDEISISGAETNVSTSVNDVTNYGTSGITSDGKLTISEGKVDVDTPNGLHAGSELTISGENTVVDVDAADRGISAGGKIIISSEQVTVSVTEENAEAVNAFGDVEISAGTYEGNIEVFDSVSESTISISGGSVTGDIVGKKQTKIEVSGEAAITGDVTAGESSEVILSGGSVDGSVTAGASATVSVTGEAEITGDVTAAESATVEMSGGSIGGKLTTGAGSDVTVTAGTVTGEVSLGVGSETSITGGTFADDSVNDYLDEGVVRDESGNVVESTPEPTPTPSSNKSSKPKYSVDVDKDDIDNGSVKLSSTRAKKGSTVTITVTPDAGYQLDELVVLDDDGNEVELTDKGNGKFTFVMPKGGVSVEASFEEIEDAPVVDEPAADEKTIVLTIGQQIILIDGEYVVNDVAPIIRGERTVLPIRVIAEALGATVTWNEADQKVTITKDDTVIEIFIGEPFALVNGEPVKLDMPAFIENGRTYLPLRFIMENLGAEVVWDGVNQTVTVIG